MSIALTAHKPKKTRVSDLVGDALCCLLASAALSLVLLTRLGHEVGFWNCFLLSAISLAFVMTFSRKWWLLPAFLVLVSGLTFLICWIFKLSDDLIEYAKGFYSWASSAFPVRLPQSENGSIVLVQLAAVLPVTAVMYLYYRKLFFFPLLPVGFAALLISMYFSESGNLHTVLVMALAVMIASLAKFTGRRIGRKKSGAEKLPEGFMQFPALVLAFIVLLFAFAFSPKADGDWKSRELVNLVIDLSDYFDFHINDINGTGSFNLSQSGFQPYGDRLGGDIDPDNETVMRVATENPALLLGSVSDTYTGTNWIDTGELGKFRFYSGLWTNKRREVFALDKPLGGRGAAMLYLDMTSTAEMKISPALRSLTLFGSGSILSIETLTGERVDAYFNLQSELFMDKGWKAFSTYVVTSVFYNRDIEGFDRNMLELEKIAYEKRDAYYDDISDRYLQLPESLPVNITKLALDIVEGKTTPYEKASAIEEWISDNCTYTLTPGDVPEGRDFVDYFLETREGYCTYYARAMTVLARSAGLPARNCTGYAMLRAAENNESSYIASNKTAHAWADIYFQGIGWVTFDPSGWNFSELIESDKPSDQGGPSVSPVIPDTEGTIGEIPEEPVFETPVITPESGTKILWPQVLFGFIGLVGALLLFFFIRLLLSVFGTNHVYYRLHRKHKNSSDMLNAAYAKLLRQLSFIGLAMQNGDTISAFAEKVDAHMGNTKMTEIVKPGIRHRCAQKKVRDADVKALCDHYIDTERKIKAEMGLPRYLWRRVLLGR